MAEWTPFGGLDFFLPSDSSLKTLWHAAALRGVDIAPIAGSLVELSHNDRCVLFNNFMPQTTSFVARIATNQKNITKELLRNAGLEAPAGAIFPKEEAEKAWSFARELGLPVVVKPFEGTGGVGVTANVSDRARFDLGWQAASRRPQIIVEQYVAGADYRVVVVGDRMVCAARREPASLTGDGRSSINELLARRNSQRARIPFLCEKPMVLLPDMLLTLERAGLTTDAVLAEGRTIVLRDVANVLAGGASIDVTDEVHPSFAEIAVRALRAMPDGIHAGIDLLASDISRPAAEQRYAICEVNSNPDLALHHFPVHGKARDAAGALVSWLFPEAEPLAEDAREAAYNAMRALYASSVGSPLPKPATRTKPPKAPDDGRAVRVLQRKHRRLRREVERLRAERDAMRNSFTWRITGPIRRLSGGAKLVLDRARGHPAGEKREP